MASKRFLQFHFLPFIIAFVITLAFIFSPASSHLISYDHGEIHSKGFQQNYQSKNPTQYSYANLSNSFSDEQEIMNYWLPKRPVVILGSSEITHWQLDAIPYNFFNAHGIPAIGIGHAGNQSLCMLTQLALMGNYLDSMRLVIILSPGWFEDHSAEGTPLATFLEYNDEHFLYYLKNDQQISAQVKHGIEDYVSCQLKEIDAPSSVLRWMAYRSVSEKSPVHSSLYSFHTNLLNVYCENKQERMDQLFYEGKSFDPFTNPWNELHYFPEIKYNPVVTNWDSLKNKTLSDFTLTCTSNTMGVEDVYFNEWMKGKPLRIIKPVPSAESQEFRDLLLLLSFLKEKNCKPLIVMQALNPLCYQNLKDLDPVLNDIELAVKKQGFEYLNLNTSDVSQYKIGMLSDFQHLGAYGWYVVDEKINSYFFQTNHEK